MSHAVVGLEWIWRRCREGRFSCTFRSREFNKRAISIHPLSRDEHILTRDLDDKEKERERLETLKSER